MRFSRHHLESWLLWVAAALVVGCSPSSPQLGDPVGEAVEFDSTDQRLQCPAGAAVCNTAPSTVWLDVGVDRSLAGEVRTEVAQTFRVGSQGVPAVVTLEIERGFSTDSAARLVVDVRLVAADGTIPGEPLPGTTLASGSLRVLSIATGLSTTPLPLLAIGKTPTLAAGTTAALVLRIEPGPTGVTALRVGASTDLSVGEGRAFVRTRPVTASGPAATPFAAPSAAVDLSWGLQLEPSATPSCTDGLAGPQESDVDCGGTCTTTCATGKKCVRAADCASGVCKASRCAAATCTNGKADPGELDVDCGGVCGTGCAAGKKCASDTDCKAGLACLGASVSTPGTCRATTCRDGIKNGTEVGLDCGGSCLPCGIGAACTLGRDCVSGLCDASTRQCAAPGCSDKVRNGAETDVDCGTSCGVGCTIGRKCASDADCVTGTCRSGTCGPSLCQDRKFTPGETDVDCGGACVTGTRRGLAKASLCAAGKMCVIDGDCATGLVCTAVGGVGRCLAPACGNGTKDGTETDVDCGGKCLPCADGLVCKSTADCRGKTCFKTRPADTTGRCQTSCSDAATNGGESDRNCGQACATGVGAGGLCAAGKKCVTDLDCASGVCDPSKRTCVDTCKNGVHDRTEGDVDCGGGCKVRCLDGQTCQAPSDCLSAACVAGVCGTPTCSDGTRNGGELGVDCGGPCPVDCALGIACASWADCAADLACKAGKCVASTCTDGLVGSTEADVDCGGVCTKTCATGKRCMDATDCASTNVCAGGLCRVAACANDTKDGTETDVDCGGACVPCAEAAACLKASDCLSRNCDATRRCAAASSTNARVDGTETDVDCGGGSAPRCADTKSCATGSDCTSGVCKAGRCAKGTCTDNARNGTETDVDCGGTCGPCVSGRSCSTGAQCVSKSCVAGKCVDFDCADGVRDGSESDVDCGRTCAQGDPARLCEEGRRCLADGDCGWGTVCRGYVCTCPAGLDCRRTSPLLACWGAVCESPPGPCFESSGTCRAGLCEYEPLPAFTTCSDGNACTRGDVCDGTGACRGSSVAGCVSACTIGGVVYAPGTRNPANACEVCAPESARDRWTAAPAGSTCSDGNDCTTWDRCSPTGTCTGTAASGPVCGSGRVCSAGACTSGCWIEGRHFDAGASNPQNPCEICRPSASATRWSYPALGTVCDDGLADTTGDMCDGVGRCLGTGSSRASLGTPCASAVECASGFCVDGVCCNTTCGAGVCDACAIRAGGRVDGVCAPVPPDTVVCRSTSTDCDATEYCDGMGTVCPADRMMPTGMPCPGGTCSAESLCIPDTGGQLAERTVGSTLFQYSYIPPDAFWRGTLLTDAETATGERPQHRVVRSLPLLMLRTEVTQAQWTEVMGTNPSAATGDPSLPVERVGWLDAVRFCNALTAREGLTPAYVIQGDEVFWDTLADGYRLPTEAEWESVAKAGGNDQRPGPIDDVAWHAGNSGGRTRAAGGRSANRWQVRDLLGNVSEWVWDRWGTYSAGTQIDPQGPPVGSDRVVRGGGWSDPAAVVRASARTSLSPLQTLPTVGFRVVRTVTRPGCTIDGRFYDDGAANPASSCQICDAARQTEAWTGLSVGTVCPEGTCNATGQCIPAPGGLHQRVIAGETFRFSFIPPGTFNMGSPTTDLEAILNERPQHNVTLTRLFVIGRTEVTQAQWSAVMGTAPSKFVGAQKPVEQVTWLDTVRFCNALSVKDGLAPAYDIQGDTVSWIPGSLGYRLPTESEWEYAARAGTTTPRYGGTVGQVAWYTLNSSAQTQVVGQKTPNLWNLYDTLGNVYEWTWDYAEYYTATSKTDPTGPSAATTARVFRGGGWYAPQKHVRFAYRNGYGPTEKYSYLGFRVARTLPPQ